MEPKMISRDMLPRAATKTANETRPRISASDCQKGINAFQKPIAGLDLEAMDQQRYHQPNEEKPHQDDLVFFLKPESGALGKIDGKKSRGQGRQLDQEKEYGEGDGPARLAPAQKQQMKCQEYALQDDINRDGAIDNEPGEINPTHEVEQQSKERDKNDRRQPVGLQARKVILFFKYFEFFRKDGDQEPGQEQYRQKSPEIFVDEQITAAQPVGSQESDSQKDVHQEVLLASRNVLFSNSLRTFA